MVKFNRNDPTVSEDHFFHTDYSADINGVEAEYRRQIRDLVSLPAIGDGLEVQTPIPTGTEIEVTAGWAYDSLGRRVVVDALQTGDLVDLSGGANWVILRYLDVETTPRLAYQTGNEWNTRLEPGFELLIQSAAPAGDDIVLAAVYRVGGENVVDRDVRSARFAVSSVAPARYLRVDVATGAGVGVADGWAVPFARIQDAIDTVVAARGGGAAGMAGTRGEWWVIDIAPGVYAEDIAVYGNMHLLGRGARLRGSDAAGLPVLSLMGSEDGAAPMPCTVEGLSVARTLAEHLAFSRASDLLLYVDEGAGTFAGILPGMGGTVNELSLGVAALVQCYLQISDFALAIGKLMGGTDPCARFAGAEVRGCLGLMQSIVDGVNPALPPISEATSAEWLVDGGMLQVVDSNLRTFFGAPMVTRIRRPGMRTPAFIEPARVATIGVGGFGVMRLELDNDWLNDRYGSTADTARAAQFEFAGTDLLSIEIVNTSNLSPGNCQVKIVRQGAGLTMIPDGLSSILVDKATLVFQGAISSARTIADLTTGKLLNGGSVSYAASDLDEGALDTIAGATAGANLRAALDSHESQLDNHEDRLADLEAEPASGVEVLFDGDPTTATFTTMSGQVWPVELMDDFPFRTGNPVGAVLVQGFVRPIVIAGDNSVGAYRFYVYDHLTGRITEGTWSTDLIPAASYYLDGDIYVLQGREIVKFPLLGGQDTPATVVANYPSSMVDVSPYFYMRGALLPHPNDTTKLVIVGGIRGAASPTVLDSLHIVDTVGGSITEQASALPHPWEGMTGFASAGDGGAIGGRNGAGADVGTFALLSWNGSSIDVDVLSACPAIGAGVAFDGGIAIGGDGTAPESAYIYDWLLDSWSSALGMSAPNFSGSGYRAAHPLSGVVLKGDGSRTALYLLAAEPEVLGLAPYPPRPGIAAATRWTPYSGAFYLEPALMLVGIRQGSPGSAHRIRVGRPVPFGSSPLSLYLVNPTGSWAGSDLQVLG